MRSPETGTAFTHAVPSVSASATEEYAATASKAASKGLARAPSASLVLTALLCANPIVMAIVGWPLVAAVAVTIATVLLLQMVWRGSGRSPATVYAVNFVALAGVWLHVEALVRTRFHDYVMEDLYRHHGGYYFNRPNLTSHLRDKEYAVDYLTNRDGFRIGASQDPQRSVGQVDWLFLGDSYTQGAQVSFEELYTTRLYRDMPDRVALNAGVSGWGLYEALAFLRDRGAALRPSVVFVQISNFNDFMKVSPRRAGLSDYLMQESEAVRLLLQDIKYQNPTDLPLGRWVEPFYTTDEENRRYNVFYTPTSRQKERDLAAIKTVLGDIATECRRLGARLVLIQIPTKEQVSFSYLEEVVAGLSIDPRLLDMDRPNRMVRAIADSLEVALVDPTEAWRASSVFPFFHYDEHLSATGHQMLADAVAEFIRESDGANVRARILSTSYSGDRYPQFVGSGDSILFHSPRGGNSEIVQADVATWTETQLTVDDATETHPIVLPQDNSLVFSVGDADRGTTRLWRSDRGGRGAVPLEPGRTDYASIPAAFPDGESLVFPSWGPQPDAARIQLTRLWLKDGRREPLPQSVEQAWRPAVDPSGRYVAYIGRVDGQYDLFELDVLTRVTQRLTTSRVDEWDPTYTPDGRSIIYASRPAGSWDLMRLRRGESKPERLTATLGDEWDPQVSPDGRLLAYGGEYGLMRGIYVLPLAP